MQIDNFADWIELNIDDLGKIITGSTPSKSKSEFYGIEYPFYKPTDLNVGYNTKISIDGLSELGIQKARFLPENTILVTCIGATIGKVGIIRKAGACNQQINAIIPYDKLLNPNFIYFQTIAPKFQKEIMNNASATTLPILNKGKFEKLLFYICPLPEQRAIVAKIEQLFSDLDNGIANLKKAQEQLKIYRQAVLKKAFEGELTRKWREEQTDLPSAEELLQQIKEEREKHYQKQLDEWKKAVKEWEDNDKDGKKLSRPKKPKELPPLSEEELNELPELPQGWCYNKLGFVTTKAVKVKKSEQDKNSDFIYLDIGGIDNQTNKIISHKRYIWSDAPSRAQQIVHVGDTLFSTVRTYLKNIAIVENEEYDRQICSSGFTVIRGLKKIIESKFTFYFCIYESFIQPLNKLQTGTSYPAVREDDVFNQPFPICSKTEQHQIVREIESRLSVCDNMESGIKQGLQKSEALRQSILKKAFEGKLLSEKELEKVRKAPDWEPAEKLLERIKAEKEKPGNKK